MQVPRRWPLVLLLAGATMLLASLYLPWRTVSCASPNGSIGQSVFDALSSTDCGGIGGWDSAAALVALALVAAAAAGIWDSGLLKRLPLGRLALLGAYYGLVVEAHVRSSASLPRSEGLASSHAYGEYLGLFGVVLVLVGAMFLRRDEIAQRRALLDLVGGGLGVALAASSLLPWWGSFPGALLPAVQAAAVLALLGAPPHRLAVVTGAAAFTAAGIAEGPDDRLYGLWIGLGCAVGIVAVSAWRSRPFRTATLLSSRVVATAATSALFFGSMFLPWLRICDSGGCWSIDGWASGGATPVAAGLLAVVLVDGGRICGLSRPPLLAAFALLALTLGVQVLHLASNAALAYGSIVGLFFAGAVILGELARVRPPRVPSREFLIRLVPIVVCIAYIVFVVLPWWYVVSPGSAFAFAPFSWLTVAGSLLAIQLIWIWTRSSDVELVIVPLLLLALAVLNLIEVRFRRLTWGEGIVVALVLLLAYLGRVEQRIGLGNWRIPELLRVDRL